MSTRPSPTLPPLVELTRPLDVAARRVLRVGVRPVRAPEFTVFLNEAGHREPDSGPCLVNTVNADAAVEFSRGRWRAKDGMDRRPMTLVTHEGAARFAAFAGLSLMNREEWAAVLELDRPGLLREPSAALNVEDAIGGPADVDRMPPGASGASGLLGNVGFWGERVSAEFAWSFGVGWNKSRIHLDGRAARQRWVRSTSVSTGIRLVLRETEGGR